MGTPIKNTFLDSDTFKSSAIQTVVGTDHNVLKRSHG